MLLEPDVLLQDRLKRFSRYAAICFIAIAIFVLMGWEWDIDLLKRPIPRLVSMNPVTAFSFVLAGIAFLLIISKEKSRSKVLSGYGISVVVVLIGVLKLVNAPVDQILFTKKIAADIVGNIPNRMAPNTAACFVLLGIALCLFNRDMSKQRIPSQYLALAIALMGLSSLIGYIYQIHNFYAVFEFMPMAIHTAICFLLASTAILFANPDRGFMKDLTSTYTGSIAARSLIPVAIVFPILLGLLRLWGDWAGFYTTEFGVAILILSIIAVFVGIIWYNTVMLNRRDVLKKFAEDQSTYFARLVEQSNDAIISMDENRTIISWNKGAEDLYGYTKSQVIGKNILHVIRADVSEEQSQTIRREFESKGSWKGELVHYDKNGNPVHCLISISPIEDKVHKGFVSIARDITERKKLEIELKKLNDELESQVTSKTAELTNVFERVSDGFMAFDKTGQITYVNKRAADLNKRSQEELIGKNLWTEFPESDGSHFQKKFYKSLEEQKDAQFEMFFEPANAWFENHMYPAEDGLSLFFSDISKRRSAEEQMLKEKDLSDSIINSLPGIFYLFDETGKFLRWNKNFETISGYGSEEISEMTPLDFFEGDEKKYIHDRIEIVFTEGTSDAEANFVTKSKEKIPHYFTGTAVSYEGKTCLIGTGIDVSQRRHAENELRQSEKKYKLLFEQNPMPMWILSLNNNDFVDVNESTLKHYGYTREEFLAMGAEKIRPAEDLQKYRNESKKTIPGISHRGIWRHMKKDGSIIHVEIYANDYIYEGRRVRLVLSNDVTERVRAEQGMIQSHKELRELASHLQDIREEERAGIAREIHDELGQQLTGMKMDISWVTKKMNGDESHSLKEKLTGTLGLLDETIKTIRRIATELRPSILDDLGLMAAIEWQSQEFEKRTGIHTRFTSEIAEQSFTPAMSIALFRICQESLTNVARYAEATDVSISLNKNNSEFLLTISDNGKGFDVTKIGYKKTLGLLGMKERTLMMGGKYEIVSHPGKGTTILVRIPDQPSVTNS